MIIIIPLIELGREFADHSVPKPLVPLFGKPLIYFIIENNILPRLGGGAML